MGNAEVVDETNTSIFPWGTSPVRLPSPYGGSLCSPGAPQPGSRAQKFQSISVEIWKRFPSKPLLIGFPGKAFFSGSLNHALGSGGCSSPSPCVLWVAEWHTRCFIHVMLPFNEADPAEHPGVPESSGSTDPGTCGQKAVQHPSSSSDHRSHGSSTFVLILCPTLCSHSSVFVSQEKNLTGSVKEARKTLFKTTTVGERLYSNRRDWRQLCTHEGGYSSEALGELLEKHCRTLWAGGIWDQAIWVC